MSKNKLDERGKALLAMIPADGATIGNVSLQHKFQLMFNPDGINEDHYWEVRQSLINEGLIERGRGRGGSVRLTSIDVDQPINPDVVLLDQPTGREIQLYDPFAKSFTSHFAKEEGLEDYVAEITALQGRRVTGGKWTRPDVAIVALRSFEFVPGKHLEVISFEIKPSISTALEGVYEALAHSIFAHRSFLAVKVPSTKTIIPNQDLERTSTECARHGVGLYTFTDERDLNTFEPVQDAIRRNPDPSAVNDFIATQLSPANKSSLKKWLR